MLLVHNLKGLVMMTMMRWYISQHHHLEATGEFVQGTDLSSTDNQCLLERNNQTEYVMILLNGCTLASTYSLTEMITD